MNNLPPPTPGEGERGGEAHSRQLKELHYEYLISYQLYTIFFSFVWPASPQTPPPEWEGPYFRINV